MPLWTVKGRQTRAPSKREQSAAARPYASSYFIGSDPVIEMSDIKVKLEYVSVGCNRTPHSVDWAPSGLLAYGADKSIALAEESCVSLLNYDYQMVSRIL